MYVHNISESIFLVQESVQPLSHVITGSSQESRPLQLNQLVSL